MGNKTNTRRASFRGYIWKAPANQPKTYGFTGTVLDLGYNRVGSNLPHYRRLIKLGQYAGTGMTVTVSNAEASSVTSEVTYRKSANPSSPDYGVVGGTFGLEGNPNPLNPPVLSQHTGSASLLEARNRAVRQLQKTFTQRRRQFQGIVAAGELMKTVGMVTRPARALQSSASRFISRLRRLRIRETSGSNWARVVADSWLELNFGWKPLLSDVRDGALALARTATRDALSRQQFRSHGSHEHIVSTPTVMRNPSLDPFNTLFYKGMRIQKQTMEIILYGVWTTNLSNPEVLHSSASRLASLSGLNWEDVPAQAWELIPWSFVVDYFSNVGDCIEAAANTEGGPKWVCEVQKLSSEQTENLYLDVPSLQTNLGGLYWHSSDTGYSSYTSYQTISRGLFNMNFFSPNLTFRLPVDMQWLNLAALVAGGNALQPFTKK